MTDEIKGREYLCSFLAVFDFRNIGRKTPYMKISKSAPEAMAMPENINGKDFEFSAGKHNELQKAIIEEFAPRFAPSLECLYIGNAIQKDLVKN